ncbi:hypothetical protein NQ315_006814 [Exocentrus adspersus]|uniref:Uncharacterized protein n=1 Tax=Exocentrus adspersus TaxID=1586481 RepID=A0AAV8WCX8_9CUCU|nr:hypothetical protein NQ315_006814 [Exocentrus adspersus]
MSPRIVKGPRISFEEITKGLGEVFFEAAGKYADNICQIEAETGKTETFRSVKERSTRVAIRLLEIGIKPGDVVACCLKNSIDSAIPVVASLYINAKVASLDVLQSSRDCAHCIQLVQPKLIFVDEDAETLIENSLVEAGFDNVGIIIVGTSSKHKMLSEMLTPCATESGFKPVAVKDCHDTAFLSFSSGTTDRSKAICITHFGLLNKIALQIRAFKKQVVSMNCASLFWFLPVAMFTQAMISGGCRVLCPEFDVETTLKYIEKYKVTFFTMPPAHTYAMVNSKNLHAYNVDSLDLLLITGSPISPGQLTKMIQLFPNVFVTTGYGATEALGGVTLLDYRSCKGLLTSKIGSVGKCAPNMEIKVVDVETRETLCANKEGEICIKTPYSMNGYYKLDSSSAYDSDGFIKTGDIGYYDEDEFLYIVSRIKEMFKYKSWQVAPTFVEEVLEQHPNVKEAVAFGIPHEIDEFHPAAFVVLKEGAEASMEDLQEFVSGQVSEFQKLRGGIKIIDAIAKTPSGKKLRRENAQMFLKLQRNV